jgi:hypothetical protein
MPQLTKKQRQDKRRKDIKSLSTFVIPVHKTLVEPINPISLVGAADSYARNEFSKKIKAATQEKGIVLAQAILYEKLLMADINSAELDDEGIKRDFTYFKEFSDELKAAGLFNRAKAVDLLLAKTKLVTSIKDVFVSKIAQKARRLKGEVATKEECELLSEYLSELKAWAINMYAIDCAQKQSLGQKIRIKTKGPDAADKWLYQMAIEDMKLTEHSFLDLSNEELKSLPDDGTLHGSPEAPDNLLDFKLSVRFFYQQIKKNK